MQMNLAEWLTVIFAALAVPQIGGPVFGALAFIFALMLRWGGRAGASAKDRLNRVRERTSGFVGRSVLAGTVAGAGATAFLFWLRH
jgi:hypothetical protein